MFCHQLTSIAHSLETKSQTDTHLSDQTDTRSSTINNKSEWPAQKSCAGSSPCNLPSKRSTTQGVSARALVGSLAFLDRFLTVWIVLAMIIGVVIGEFADGVQDAFTSRAELQGVAAPLVVGLIVMMWPILTKVQYERFPEIFQSRGIWIHIGLSILLNWVVAPWVMTGLAWATLPDLEDFRTGIILVGIARCIAMVNIWAALAKGDTDVCAILVIINSLLQIVLFSPYSLLLINIVGSSNSISLNYSEVAKAVAIYLGIPLGAGILTRFTMLSLLGRKRFQTKFLPYFGPLSLVALLYVIIVIFALQAKNVLDNLGPTFRCFVPLIIYFILMWSSTFLLIYVLSRRHNKVVWNYEMAVVQSFTTGSNNFELAIAISVSTFGASSNQTLATTIGPLVEIPVLVILTYVSLFLGKRLTWNRSRSEKGREKMEERQEDTLQEA
ncbi:unnamed protein product [Sympodiomycopsis kandeliae]